MTKVAKKKNRRLRKQIRKTVGALLMVSAIVVAAVPVTDVSAKPETATETGRKVWVWDDNQSGAKDTSLQGESAEPEATKNTIPYVASNAIVYTSGDGRFQFAYVDPDEGSNKYAVILNYNASALTESSLTIPDTMEAFRKYKETSSDGFFCLVTQNDEFMFYDVYEQATNDEGILLYSVPGVKYGSFGHPSDPTHPDGESITVNQKQLYYSGSDSTTLVYRNKEEQTNEDGSTSVVEVEYPVEAIMVTNQKPCYYENRSEWGDLEDTELYYQAKGTVSTAKPNGDLTHPTDQAHWRIDATVKYIGQQKVKAIEATDSSTGITYISKWEVGDYRKTPDEGVFANNANITNLTIGDNLSGISDYAFQGCTTLQSVSFGNNLTTLGNGAFANCIRLSTCNIPINANLQALGKDAFYNCTALTSFTMPINVKAIGDCCFEGCTRLQTIDLCGGSELDTALVAIGNSAFKNCSALTSVTFPSQYAEDDLEISVFEGCSSLQYIKVPNKSMNFKQVDLGYTFNNFKETVPESFYFWGADTKTNDRNNRSELHKTANTYQIAYKYFNQEVYEIVIKEGNDDTAPSITYQVNDQNELVKIWLEHSPVNVKIPKTIGPYGISSIGTGCFNDACTIKRVTIPETVLRIEDGAFKGSHNLETVIFDDASTIQYIGTDAFRTQVVSCGCSITAKDPELTFVGAMINDDGEDTVPFVYAMTPENMINNPDQNKSWITCHSGFPTNIEVKYVYDFTTNEGSAQMQSYPRYDSYSSTNLEEWVKSLPYVNAGVTDEVQYYKELIEEALSKYSTSDPTDPPTEKQMDIINAALNVVVPTNVDSLKPGLFSGYEIDEDGNAKAISGMTPDTKIQSIVLNGVDEIEPYTFTGCESLKNVSIINATKLDDYAFGAVETVDSTSHVTSTNSCEKLEQVTLGANITEVGKRPFAGCTNLNTITCMGDNLSYQNGILCQNKNGEKILIECLEGRGDAIGSYTVGPEELAGVTQLQEEAFMNADHVGKVDLSDTTIDKVPKRAFYDMDELNSVILPDTVKNIEAESFKNSPLLRVLTIPGNQSYIEKDAFENKIGTQQTIEFECVKGTTADRYAEEYDYINPEYGKVYVEHTVCFWDYPDYPDTSTKALFYKVKVRDGEDAVPPTESPSHDGVQFTGWTDYTKISKDTDVWPRFGDHVYVVRFIDWDGTVIEQEGFTNPQYVEAGKSATPPATDPVREGYTFAGWTPDYHSVSDDLTVIAKYTDNSSDQSRHTVTFYAYENNKMTAISVQKVNHGEAAVAPAVPSRSGYTFTGWYPDKTVFSEVTTDLTIVASYDKNGSGSSSSPSKSPSSSASASPTATSGSGSSSDNVKKYTVSVSGGSGSGSYAAGAIVALNAYDMGVGKNFDKWTTSTAGVGFANAEATSTTFTMPAANVAITATYKTGTGTTTASSGSSQSGSGSSGSTGSTSSGSTSKNGTSVEVTKPGISNTNLAGATVAGSTDNFVVKVTEDQNANDMAVAALQARYGNISNIKYLPMDISLYDSTGRTKIADTSGISVNITLPLPDDLAQYAGNNKVASTLGGTLEDLNTRFTTVDGVPCVNFTATHFSPYVIYVDTANLTQSTIDATPKTGDPIHPKWFLAIGLASLSLVLFFKKDKKVVKPRTA